MPAATVKVLPGWNIIPSSEYAYGIVPPPAVAVSVVVPPLHNMLPAAADAVRVAGSVTVTVAAVPVHPLASFTTIS